MNVYQTLKLCSQKLGNVAVGGQETVMRKLVGNEGSGEIDEMTNFHFSKPCVDLMAPNESK